MEKYEIDVRNGEVKFISWAICPRCDYEYETEVEVPIEEVLKAADAIKEELWSRNTSTLDSRRCGSHRTS